MADDLKACNLPRAAISESWSCIQQCFQVADFNLSKVMEGSVASTVGGASNPRWMAPELLSGAQGTPAADVFAFGVVMWEVLTWDIPWQTDAAFEVWLRACGCL
jgi:serine/threonine protein kinase